MPVLKFLVWGNGGLKNGEPFSVTAYKLFKK